MNTPHDPDLLLAQIAPDGQSEALALYWPELTAAERISHFERASAGSVSSLLWGAWRDQRLVGVARGHIQPGRTATIAVPRLAAEESLETAGHLIEKIRSSCREAGCQSLYALLPEADGRDAKLLRLGGLRQVADLLLLVSLPPYVSDESHPLDIRWQDVAQVGVERFAAVVQSTYTDSLDSPQIDGSRDVSDVLAGYQASGPFAPERWLVANRGGEDVGCLILTADLAAPQWELTYLGVVPSARGCGLGRQLVRYAQRMTHEAGQARLVVAVDALNAPARRVYDACGFIEYGKQCAFWCAI